MLSKVKHNYACKARNGFKLLNKCHSKSLAGNLHFAEKVQCYYEQDREDKSKLSPKLTPSSRIEDKST